MFAHAPAFTAKETFDAEQAAVKKTEAAAQENESRAIAQRAALARAQTDKAHIVRADRLGRRHPEIRALVGRHKTLHSTHAIAQKDLAALGTAHTELSAEFQRVAKEKADLEVKFAAAAETALTLTEANSAVAGQLAAASAQIGQLTTANAALADELAAARAELKTAQESATGQLLAADASRSELVVLLDKAKADLAAALKPKRGT